MSINDGRDRTENSARTKIGNASITKSDMILDYLESFQLLFRNANFIWQASENVPLHRLLRPVQERHQHGNELEPSGHSAS